MIQIQSAPKQFEFQGLGRRTVVAGFDGGTISSEGGALLLRELDRRCRILDAFAGCFVDRRDASYREHPVHRLVAQRVYGLCLGYEDLNDHEQLRYDPLFATLCEQHDVEGRCRVRPADVGKALAGKATLQRLESTPAAGADADRYHKISHEPERIREFFIEHFLSHYNRGKRPKQIVIDLDATDDPLHGNQEGRFFHGYSDRYCYLPLYAFCDGYLLAAELRPANIDACAGADEVLERIVTAVRLKWPKTRIIVRADSGFAREWLMGWCEEHRVEYVLGLARNKRLRRAIGKSMREATELFASSNRAARVYEDLTWPHEKKLVTLAPGGRKG